MTRSNPNPLSRGRSSGIPWLRLTAWISLAVAFVLGLIWQQPDYTTLLQGAYPKGGITPQEQTPNQYQMSLKGEHYLVSINESQGYGGPMLVASLINDRGRVEEVKLLQHKETPGYVARFDESQYYRQFAGKQVNDDFLLGEDIDALSGATLTSRGLTSAVREGTHAAADPFGFPADWQEPQLVLGAKELAAFLLFVAAFMHKRLPRKHQARFNQLLGVASVVLIGYWLNSALSMALVGSLLLGYIPSPQQHLLWYIMLAGALGAILFMGRNLYCSQLCPFHQIQRWLHRLSGLNLQLHPWLKKRLKQVTNTLLWLSLMLIFLSRTPAIGSYEPFSMLFSLDGLGVQWYILPLSLFGAFLVSDFWCRLLCPLGRFLNYSLEARARAMTRFKKGGRIAVRDASQPQSTQRRPGYGNPITAEKRRSEA
ncbi:FMN-binding protein [Ferrimonas sp.]|uniref:FMN-binding protein n=1 Tax=Ferrimonas sp. TaxID=2080861 RepID=UPI003A8E6842